MRFCQGQGRADRLDAVPPADKCSSRISVSASNAIKFSNEESKQTYAISIKVPAIQVEFRRMLPFEDDNGGKLSYTLNGTLYPDEQVVIYDIGDVKPETEKKRRGRRKKSEIEAEQKEN